MTMMEPVAESVTETIRAFRLDHSVVAPTARMPELRRVPGTSNVLDLAARRQLRTELKTAKAHRESERDRVAQSEARQRWWDAWCWLSEHHHRISAGRVRTLLDVLERGSQTAEQDALPSGLVELIAGDGSDSDD